MNQPALTVNAFFLPLGLILCTLLAQSSHAQSLLVIENPAERLSYGKTYTQADGFISSDTLPLTRLTDEPQYLTAQAKNGQNLSMASARTALGAWIGALNVDYFFRREWWLEGNADALDVYQLTRQNRLLSAGRPLDFNYRWQGFDADGLRFSFANKVSLLSSKDTVIGFSIAALRLQQIRQENGSGQLTLNSDGSASLHSQRSIWYSGFQPSNSTNGQSSFTPTLVQQVPDKGYGYNVDFGLRYNFGAGGAVRIALNDVLEHIQWYGLPHVVQQADIQNSSKEQDFSIAPSGRMTQTSTYETLHLDLPNKRSVAIDYPISYKWQLHAEKIGYRSQIFTLLGASVRVNDSLCVRADYESRWKTLGLRFGYQNLSIALRADSLSPSRAQAAGGSLHLETDF